MGRVLVSELCVTFKTVVGVASVGNSDVEADWGVPVISCGAVTSVTSGENVVSSL